MFVLCAKAENPYLCTQRIINANRIMKRLKKKQRKRTHHLLSNAVLRTLYYQYTGKRMGPDKIELWCWLDGNRRGRIRIYKDLKNDRAIIVWLNGQYYSAPDTRDIYWEPCSMNMEEYKRLNSHF